MPYRIIPAKRKLLTMVLKKKKKKRMDDISLILILCMFLLDSIFIEINLVILIMLVIHKEVVYNFYGVL